jgi:nucleotide-binding universal stress UspA family protein
LSYKCILAVVDDATAGRRALRAAAEIAAAAHATLAPLRLVDEPWPFIDPGEVEAKRALRGGAWQVVARERVAAELHRRVAELPSRPPTVLPLVRFGAPAVDIARAAEDEAADLIVMGTAPAGVLDDVLLRTRVPCLIVPPAWDGWRRLVVWGEVYREAFAFAELFRSDVIVVDAEPQRAAAGADRVEAAARKAFAVWYKAPGTGGLDLVSLHGDPATQTLDIARSERADVLVLPYPRGAGAGVVSAAARAADCAVLLVPA